MASCFSAVRSALLYVTPSNMLGGWFLATAHGAGQPAYEATKPPRLPTLTNVLPSNGAGAGLLGSGAARPCAFVEFVSAHTAYSKPLPASARAWLTRIWLAAMTGSVCDSTLKASMSVVRRTRVIIAIGIATPRSLIRCCSAFDRPISFLRSEKSRRELQSPAMQGGCQEFPP